MTDTKHTDEQLREAVYRMKKGKGWLTELAGLWISTQQPIKEPIPAFYRGQRRIDGHAVW